MERFGFLLFAVCGFPSCRKSEHASPHAPLFVARSEGSVKFQYASATSGPDPGHVSVFCSQAGTPARPRRNLMNPALCTFAATQRRRREKASRSIYASFFLSLSMLFSSSSRMRVCVISPSPLAFVPFCEKIPPPAERWNIINNKAGESERLAEPLGPGGEEGAWGGGGGMRAWAGGRGLGPGSKPWCSLLTGNQRRDVI